MAEGNKRPRVFFDIAIGGVKKGRIAFELYNDSTSSSDNRRAERTYLDPIPPFPP
ncbi:hypothetical protein DPSP01_007428 [Paraphaeosphaeria sporulosa]